MDLNIVTLEITTLIIAFNHYDALVFALPGKTEALNQDYQKIRNKTQSHLDTFFGVQQQLGNLAELKEAVHAKLTALKTKEIHELAEQLEKDAKKMKKLYKSIVRD